MEKTEGQLQMTQRRLAEETERNEVNVLIGEHEAEK